MTGEQYVRGRDLGTVFGTVTWVYTTAGEMLGDLIPESERAKLWSQISEEQALVVIAAILSDIDLSLGQEKAEVDRRWASRVSNTYVRDRLLVSSHLGRTLFAPQLLLIAVREALNHCPPGPPTNDVTGLDVVVLCLLGIGDEASSTMGQDSWGGLPGGLAAEMIANQYFNRSTSIGHQLTWIDRAWFHDWPKPNKATQTVGGQPRELFEEATGVRLEDFATVAINLYVQTDRHVRFPPRFFESLGLPKEATDHFIMATSQTVAELRTRLNKEAEESQGSLYAFNTLRRFPLVRLSSGTVLVLRVGFVVERALSEVTYFDVRSHLKKVDISDGTKRDEAFRSCTNDVLEHEAGVTLQRMFSKGRGQILTEVQLQKKFSSKTKTASVCDYAIRTGSTWLLIEVTDRAIPSSVVFAQANATALDAELDKVLTDRKARQLASTIDLLRQSEGGRGGSPSKELTFIPLVLTAPGGLGWNSAVHHRVRERLTEDANVSEEFASSVALVTLKDLRILENAASHGHDVIEVLRSWRERAPAEALDNYLLDNDIPFGPPEWEKSRAGQVIDLFINRMKSRSQH